MNSIGQLLFAHFFPKSLCFKISRMVFIKNFVFSQKNSKKPPTLQLFLKTSFFSIWDFKKEAISWGFLFKILASSNEMLVT